MDTHPINTVNALHTMTIGKTELIFNIIRALGSLVLLGYDITAPTPVAYLRHRL